MQILENLQNFNLFKRNKSLKDTSELQLKQVAEFTLSLFDGDHDAIYSTKINEMPGMKLVMNMYQNSFTA